MKVMTAEVLMSLFSGRARSRVSFSTAAVEGRKGEERLTLGWVPLVWRPMSLSQPVRLLRLPRWWSSLTCLREVSEVRVVVERQR